jgi:peptidyl-tRNA hydrolase, PTH1 family
MENTIINKFRNFCFKYFKLNLSDTFEKEQSKKLSEPMKYLIAGLGNIGSEYEHTRHNIGFDILDKLAKEEGLTWNTDTLAYSCEMKYKGRTLILIKPTTYMNLSGKAVSHHLAKHKIPKENLLVVLDDLNLDFGILRLRDKGSDGGHNGLKNIDLLTLGNTYARLRVGIGSKFHKGQQANFVLGKWKKDEAEDLAFIIDKSVEAIKSYASIGIKHSANQYNGNVLKID